ncbi:MAG TPA: Ig-like domain-containing protein, partial [Candidatus Sulfopaludibacter sp.]|nr:Ig-like domain-containing protein [Candidatus Sulfopaludibacter sp.]
MNQPFNWTLNPQIGTLQIGNPSPSGSNTYIAPSAVSSKTNVTVTATEAGNPSVVFSAVLTLVGTNITISPTSASLTTGQTQQFTATVSGANSNVVVWSISPQTGTIDQTGLYTAPAAVGATSKVTVTATSQADPTKSASAVVTLSQTIDIGSGAPAWLVQQFFSAFYRNGFNLLVGLPPLGTVKTLGSTPGFYVQEFPDAAKTSGVRYALASASASVSGAAPDGSVTLILQIDAPVYAYYLTIGATTAGYPLADTGTCPSFDPTNSCMFQLFDKNYALFVYGNPLGTTGATNFPVSGTIYTEWSALGGVGGIGLPTSAPASITATKIPPATAGSAASAQTFSNGAIYSIASGTYRGQVHGVAEPIYDMYVAAGGPTGPLGLPTSEVLVYSSGLHKQTFEGGALQYTPGGGGGPVLPVTAVNLTGATAGSTVNLNLGQSVTLTATPVDAQGDQLTDRPVTWSSTNGQAVSIQPQPNSQSAVITAIGGGTANVTAASGGVTSGKVTFVVTAPCCQVGDGAPLSVQSAFQSALTRNQVTAQTPVAAPAIRSGSGYIQMVQSNNSSAPVTYLIAQSDQSGSAFLVSAALLSAYQALGGPAGSMGYPASDASAGGTQQFQNGALAGSPVRIVSGPILAKWGLLGYETGAAGPPVSD